MKKSFITFLGSVAIAATVIGTNSCRSVSPAQREMEAYADSVANNVARLQINHRKFVLSGDQLVINNSPLINVSENTNFVLVDGERGVAQISPRFSGGPNSVGGFTISGEISKYEVKESKSGDVTVTYRISGAAGSSEVRVLLHNGRNKAEATVTGTFTGGRATIYGDVKALDSQYFEGRSF